jgi:hypothetical protein
MNSARRRLSERLDRVGLASHKDGFDAAEFSGQKDHDGLPPSITNCSATREPAAFDDVNEFVGFLHLDQYLAPLKNPRSGHRCEKLGLAALQ